MQSRRAFISRIVCATAIAFAAPAVIAEAVKPRFEVVAYWLQTSRVARYTSPEYDKAIQAALRYSSAVRYAKSHPPFVKGDVDGNSR